MNRLLGLKTAPLGEYAWYVEDSASKTHPGSGTKANAWGLVNMLGNVREFCLDWYDPEAYAHLPDSEVVDPRGPASGQEHVVRGGSYRSDAADLRCAARDHTRHDEWLLTDPQAPKSIWWYSDCTDVGFRVVREMQKEESRSKNQEARSKKQEARSKEHESRSKRQEARSVPVSFSSPPSSRFFLLDSFFLILAS